MGGVSVGAFGRTNGLIQITEVGWGIPGVFFRFSQECVTTFAFRIIALRP